MRRSPAAAIRLADLLRRARVYRLPTALPVVAFVYAGLGAVAAAGLLLATTLTPIAPSLQPAAEPARQVVTNLVQPAADVVALVSAPPPVWVEASPTPAQESVPSDEPLGLAAEDLETPTAESIDASAVQDMSDVEVPARAYMPAAKTVVSDITADQDVAPAESEGGDIPDPNESTQPESIVIESAAATPVLKIAGEDVQPLSSTPTPTPIATSTEAPLQAKARQDAANQAAIDAAKADQVRAKATANAANQAAIDARHAADDAAVSLKARTDAANETAIALAKTMFTPTALPTKAPVGAPGGAAAASRVNPVMPTEEKLTRPQADATNQAVIDATRAAKARAKTDANAANQAAIDAARSRGIGQTVTPAPPPTAVATPAPHDSAASSADATPDFIPDSAPPSGIPDEAPAVATDASDSDSTLATDSEMAPAVPEQPHDQSAAD